jgi:hypothetical protein
MKKYINKLTAGVLLLACTFLNVACEDIDDIHELNLDRILSPTDLAVRIRNNVNAEVSWTPMEHARTYTLEVYMGESAQGTPVVTVADIVNSSYTVTQLEGESSYIVQVKCVGTDIADSKWSAIAFTTGTEQILQAIDIANDLEATRVTLRWPAGQTATSIVLTPEDGSADITYTVTADDIAAGAATITGLTDEMTYTAKLINGAKTRGIVTFTTPIDIGNATLVEAGEDLAAVLENAAEGEVFALMPGIYEVATLNISKSIALKAARPADKPILMSTIIRMSNNAGLELNGLVLDGTNSSGDQTVVYGAGDSFGALVINNCEIKNYTKGALYVNNKSFIKSILITSSIYSNIECAGGDLFDMRNGIAESFIFTNNTVYNSAAARDGFRMDAGGSGNYPDIKSVINISNNTFNAVCDGNNRRLLYIRLASNEITFNKNILSNTAGYYTNQAATKITEMSNNNYFNAPNFAGSTQSNATNDKGTYTTLDPGYADAGNGDFTLSNDDLIYYQIGDARWR